MEFNLNSIPKWNSNKYSYTKYIDSGFHGIVFEGLDNVKQKKVAIKWIEKKKDQQYKSIYRELCILRHIRSHYLIQLLDVQICMKDENISGILFALPLMEYDLDSMLHKEEHQSYKEKVPFDGIIKILYQLLKGLQYLYDAGIIHRDLKLSNIGINDKYELRILDFGTARDEAEDMTKKTQTFHYRAIEVFSDKHTSASYTRAIDMWSVGCILSELFTRKVLFDGKNEYKQVEAILSITGLPKEHTYPYLEKNYRRKASPENKLRNHIEKDIITVVCHEDETRGNLEGAGNVMNLICSMLELDPNKRPTPIHAMNSELFHQYSDLVKDYPDDSMVDLFKCDYDNDTIENIQVKIIDAINNFEPILS